MIGDLFQPATMGISLAWMRESAEMARSPRRQIEWAAAQAFGAVALDATHPDTRPRDLDRSARRDLAALLRRLELRSAGVDLWIPEEHLRDPTRLDRAVAAIEGACALAAELAALAGGAATVHLSTPHGALPDVTQAIERTSQRAGAAVADYAWPAVLPPDPSGLVGVGIDPATLLAAGADPVSAVIEHASHVKAARLSDLSRSGPTIPGRGRLDLRAYVAAVNATLRTSPIILDLRGVTEPLAAAESLAAAWLTG